jgi:hypothetical protein
MLLATVLSCSTVLFRMRPGVLIGSRYTVVKMLLELLMRAYTLQSCNCPCQCCCGLRLRLLFPLLSYDYDLRMEIAIVCNIHEHYSMYLRLLTALSSIFYLVWSRLVEIHPLRAAPRS